MVCKPAVILLVLFSSFISVPLALATTWYVNGKHGSDNDDCKIPQHACKTIGHAISLASSGDSIVIAPAIYKENLTITIDLQLLGTDSSITVIDGQQENSVISIPNSGNRVKISKLTMRNGAAPCGGGLYNQGIVLLENSAVVENSADSDPAYGGGICNFGTMTIKLSTIRRNTTGGGYDSFGVGILNGGTLVIEESTINDNVGGTNYTYGGGIGNESEGSVTINRSTISGNQTPNGAGAGIDNEGGTVAVVNSTISKNVASYGGGAGGIGNEYSGTVTIHNCTISGNRANFGGGLVNVPGSTLKLQNSIVANNSSGNCGYSVTSEGYNLSNDKTCEFTGRGDMNNTDPLLGPLRDNGGPTKTHALLKGSPATDAGNPKGCTDSRGHLLKTDQRGYPRPGRYKHDKRCDMGAFERQSD
jgi:hypothetical protein